MTFFSMHFTICVVKYMLYTLQSEFKIVINGEAVDVLAQRCQTQIDHGPLHTLWSMKGHHQASLLPNS